MQLQFRYFVMMIFLFLHSDADITVEETQKRVESIVDDVDLFIEFKQYQSAVNRLREGMKDLHDSGAERGYQTPLLIKLSDAFNLKGEKEAAIEAIEEAIRIDDLIYGKGKSPVFASELSRLCSLYLAIENFYDVIPHLEILVSHYEKKLGIEDDKTLVSVMDLAYAYFREEKYKKASKTYKKHYKHFKPDDKESVVVKLKVLMKLTGSEMKVNKMKSALKYATEANKIIKHVYGQGAFEYSDSCNVVAVVLEKLGRYDEAIEFMKKSYDLPKNKHGEDHPQVKKAFKHFKSFSSFIRNKIAKRTRSQKSPDKQKNRTEL